MGILWRWQGLPSGLCRDDFEKLAEKFTEHEGICLKCSHGTYVQACVSPGTKHLESYHNSSYEIPMYDSCTRENLGSGNTHLSTGTTRDFCSFSLAAVF